MMVWLLAMVVAVSPDLPDYQIPAAIESSPIHAVTGNGRLTAGIDSAGRIAQLRWPTLGYWEHIAYDYSAEPFSRGGGCWVLVKDGVQHLLSSDRMEITHEIDAPGILVTRFQDPSGSLLAEQRVYVAEDADIVVIELVLEDSSSDTEIFWYQHLRPATRLVSGISERAVPSIHPGGFATFYDEIEGILVQFRPAAPGQGAWASVRALARGPATIDTWSTFDNGVYWGTFSPDGVLAGGCAGPNLALAGLIEGRGTHQGPSAVGAAHGMLQVKLIGLDRGGRRGTVCLAVAESMGELQQRQRMLSVDGLSRPATFPPEPRASIVGEERNAVASLLATIDEHTGAVLRAPVSEPALAHAAIFDTAWATAALDQWGYGALAEDALLFHYRTMRADFLSTGAPGSLPAVAFTTGEPAGRLDRANPVSTAWLLAATWRHCALQSTEARRNFLETWEEKIIDGGDYLARAPTVGGVLSGALKPAAASLETLQTHYLGLVSARFILEGLGREEPEHWQRRREETYARIRFRQLNRTQPPTPESDWLALWVWNLPESASADEGSWGVLKGNAPPRAPQWISSTASETKIPPSTVPIALRDALVALGIE